MDPAKCFQLAALMMVALFVTILIRIDNNRDVVTLQNIVFLKSEDNSTTKNAASCNLFYGKWVYDDVSYPLYREGDCSLMGFEWPCHKYGRQNLTYQNWRWQPHNCNLPRFNGTALLEKLRNKRLVFVGDSLNRNTFRSLTCLMEPYLPPSTNKTVAMDLEANSLKLHVKDYNTTFEFHWSPYLVETSADDILHHRGAHRTVRLHSITKHARQWTDADVLVFDTYAWWDSNMTILWGSFDSPDAIRKEVDSSTRPYEIALNTWSDWLEFHIDRQKTKIFFMGISPYHPGSTFQGTSAECYYVTEPILDERKWPKEPKWAINKIKNIIEKLGKRGVKVEYLNITQLSAYREDAHPSVYLSHWQYMDPKAKDPNRFSDCLHWCLPGVPDVWNQILYSYIMN